MSNSRYGGDCPTGRQSAKPINLSLTNIQHIFLIMIIINLVNQLYSKS
jgi:hypothetical protein